MIKLLKYILVIVGMLILLTVLTIKLYFHYDVPEYNGKHSLLELQDTVEVFTDPYGVPHIFAKSNKDLFFTAGYILARERLFQLSLLAAVARGECGEDTGRNGCHLGPFFRADNGKQATISRDSGFQNVVPVQNQIDTVCG